MITAYKHVSTRYADAFESGKSIQVGTYSYYRTLKWDRADTLEGAVINRISRYTTNKEGPPSEDDIRIMSAAGFRSRGIGATFINCSGLMTMEDDYLFCASAEPDFTRPDEVIFEISDMELFGHRLVLARRDLFYSMKVKPVSYESREAVLPAMSPAQLDPFIKRMELAHEKEIRICLRPINGGKKPTEIVDSPKAAKLVRRLT